MQLPKPPRRGRKPPRPIARYKRPARTRRRDDRGALRELADDVMSLYVRHKAGWRCWRCENPKYWEMQMAHIIPKGAHPTGRYIERNVRCLCSRCHTYYTHHSEEWREYVINRIGQAAYDELWVAVRVRQGEVDYRAEILYWWVKLRALPMQDAIQERVEKLMARTVKMQVLVW